jgi:hypothetical protein
MLGAQVRLARQYAISTRQRVAVIMPGPAETTLPAASRFTVFRVATVSGTGSPFTFVNWVPNTKWERLPPGAAIMEADNDTGIYSSAASSYSIQPHEDPTDYSRVDGVPLDDVIGGDGSSASGVRALVFHPNGKVLGNTTWVTVGDALFEDTGSWRIPDSSLDTENASPPKAPADETNRSTANQISLVLDTYTGRCVYRTPSQYGD